MASYKHGLARKTPNIKNIYLDQNHEHKGRSRSYLTFKWKTNCCDGKKLLKSKKKLQNL